MRPEHIYPYRESSMFRKFRREVYLLSRGERRGLLLVSLLLLISLGIRVGVELAPDPEVPGVAAFEEEARTFMALLAEEDSLEVLRRDSVKRSRKTYYPGTSSRGTKHIRQEAFQKIDLNLADSAELLPLPGIGPVFAGRIIKYRNLLGGFVRADQLREVYGMPLETVERISSLVFIDTTVIRKICLDSASFSELLRHPYLEYEEVKALVEYREFKQDNMSAQELRDQQILPDTILNIIDAYFDYR